ncbi:uncharacterized protein LOC143038827 isoform X3 [Oratosquilla oratoria]|uniref:uncharacterized protein LOC143038827 isoform X3 n=1 Tax=Oratosquilla oratoria TaxID=337810 RepID=UPI003F76890D
MHGFIDFLRHRNIPTVEEETGPRKSAWVYRFLATKKYSDCRRRNWPKKCMISYIKEIFRL